MAASNVLLVVMDTSRARNALPTTNPDLLPNLRRLAEEGVVFDNAITTGPWTLPSHASLFTGQYTTDHGTHGGTQYFDPDVTPLASRLRASGYRTAAVSNNTWVTPEFGFGAGFDDFYVRSKPLPDGEDPAVARNRLREAPFRAVADLLGEGRALSTAGNLLYDRFLRDRHDDGARLTNWRIERWLADSWDDDRPFFLFANYIEPHLSYRPPEAHLPEGFDAVIRDRVEQDPWAYIFDVPDVPEPDFEALEALYEAELSYLDAKIGELFDLLRERGVMDETAIVVVGDHGENIGDHGLMDHQFCLYDTLLRVPLLVRPPSGSDGDVISSLVEVRDLFPTILDLAGADAPTAPTVAGRSLLDLVGGRPGRRPHREYTISEYVTPRPPTESLEERYPDANVDPSRYDRSLRCIRTRRWKYVQTTDGRDELFDLEADPMETENLIDDRVDVRERLRRKLSTEHGPLERANERRYAPSAETEERLDSLGYI